MILGDSYTKMPYPMKVFHWLWSMDTRALELTFGLLILLRGIALTVVPNSMENEVYASFRESFSQNTWGLFCILAGGFQMAGVFINGNWRRSPWLRFSGATVSAVFYSMLGMMFAETDFTLAATTYLPMTFAMVWTAINIASKQ